MSRYVTVALAPRSREDLLAALFALGLEPEVAGAGEALMLEGSLECAGEPVEIRLGPGTLGTVEDFGFAQRDGAWTLVCGELDRSRLDRELVPKLRSHAAIDRVRAAAQAEGARVEESIEPDGTRRLVIKRNE